MPTPYERMLSADYQARHAARQAKWFRRWHKVCDFGVAIGSSTAVLAMLADAAAPALKVVISAVAAVLGVLAGVMKFADLAAEYDTQARDWKRVYARFEDVWELQKQDRDPGPAGEWAEREFDALSEKMEDVNHDTQCTLYREVMAAHGFNDTDIKRHLSRAAATPAGSA